MPQLYLAGAAGKQWLGIPFWPVDSLYLSAEDETDELHRRINAIGGQVRLPSKLASCRSV